MLEGEVGGSIVAPWVSVAYGPMGYTTASISNFIPSSSPIVTTVKSRRVPCVYLIAADVDGLSLCMHVPLWTDGKRSQD